MNTLPLHKSAAVESWEDHVEAWHHLGRQVDGAAWGRAAISASLKGRYGDEAVDKFADEVGFSRATIYDFARTFEVFSEKSERSDNLTFSHHLLAARLTANAAEAKAAVEQAAREGWSANALRAYLRPPALPAPAGEACADTGACGPLTTDAKIFHIAALIEKFEAIKTYEIAPLVHVGTKKSLRELSRKLDDVAAWLSSLQEAINRRLE